MSQKLTNLAEQAKYNNHALSNIIQLFSPKIKSSLKQTNHQDREDLSQELKLKLIIYIRNYDVDDTPGFFDIFEEETGT